MATTNYRVGQPQSLTVNGVDAGGLMSAAIRAGYDEIVRSSPDGLAGPPISDRLAQYVRGTITTQDWIEAINLLDIGSLGTKVFYERKSGVDAGTGYIKHTITNPVIHRIALAFRKGSYATCAYDFECRAADETKTIADMWAPLDSQAAPSHITAARGGCRIDYGSFQATPSIGIKHITALDISIALNLVKESNEHDIGYTCVDARLEGTPVTGSITIQDSAVSSSLLTAQRLIAGGRKTMSWLVLQSQGAANKECELKGVQFTGFEKTSDVNTPFSEFRCDFEICNDPALPLTLDGTTKILSITDES